MRSRTLLLGVVTFLAFNLHAQCGVERWSVKTGTDSQAPSINLGTYISSTIYSMQQSAAPGSLPANSRVAPRELNQYRITGTLTKYKKEGDSDYHLVIQDSSGRTIIVEIPSSNCVGGGSPFGPGISNARRQFDARFTATSTMKTTSTAVAIRGIGFWDYLHGQTGAAPNGIEVHPVLDITFTGAAALAPGVQIESILEGDQQRGPADDVRYPADVVVDEDGGRVRLYRGGDAIGDPMFHGGPVIEEPSVQVIFVGDRWEADGKRPVMNMVRRINSDSRFEQLSRFGVQTFGMRTDSRQIAGTGDDMTDLDVQRALATAVESGRIQHLDENTVYVVVLDPETNASIASQRDWSSYHSQFHPNELAMRYVVVRGGLDRERMGEAISASLFRALVNPAGNGWF
jgi:hypothetical protein